MDVTDASSRINGCFIRLTVGERDMWVNARTIAHLSLQEDGRVALGDCVHGGPIINESIDDVLLLANYALGSY